MGTSEGISIVSPELAIFRAKTSARACKGRRLRPRTIGRTDFTMGQISRYHQLDNGIRNEFSDRFDIDR